MFIEFILGNCDRCRDRVRNSGENKFRELHPELIEKYDSRGFEFKDYKPLSPMRMWSEEAKNDWKKLAVIPLNTSYQKEYAIPCCTLSIDYEIITLCKKCLLELADNLR